MEIMKQAKPMVAQVLAPALLIKRIQIQLISQLWFGQAPN